MKTIFITVYDGDTEKVILRSGVFAHLKESGHRIVLLIRGAERVAHYQKDFASESVIVEALPQASSTLERLWYYIGWNTIPTHSVRFRRRRDVRKNGKWLRYFVGSVLGILGYLRLWRELLRTLYRYSPDSYANELFKKYNPDLVFTPNMFSAEDCRMLRAAKKRRVKTIATVKSWDVLTTKAFTRVKADHLLVFNTFNREEAITIGDYPPKRITITGFPQFDIYARDDWKESREAFCKPLGLDPEKRFVLFAIPGDWKTPYTKEVLQALDDAIESGAFSKPLQILGRLHPKYPDGSERETYRHIVVERPGTYLAEGKEFSPDMGTADTFKFTFTDKDVTHLANSLYHSNVVLNTESTITLDAAALDKPTVLVAYDGAHKLPYLDSVARIYERNHYRHVVDTKATPLAHSDEELIRDIEEFLTNPEYLRRERDQLQSDLLYKLDGKSGERTAAAVLSVL